MGVFLSAFFFSVCLSNYYVLQFWRKLKKKHKEGLLFFVISSEIHCNFLSQRNEESTIWTMPKQDVFVSDIPV